MKPLHLFFIFTLISFACNGQHNGGFSDCGRHKSRINIAHTENEFTQTYNVTSYDFDLHLNPDTLFVSGSVTIHFIPNEDLTHFIFDLRSSLTVDSIDGNTTHYTRQQEFIVYEKAFQEGVPSHVKISYHGGPPAQSTAFVKGSHNGTPILWTLSEPYGASHWWPCKESLTDKADSATLKFTVPKGNKAGSNGLLVHTQHTDSTSTFTWKTNYPTTTYLFAVAVTNYAVIEQTYLHPNGQMQLLDYVYPEDSAAAYQDLLRTDSLLQLYDSMFIPYPFMREKYGHAQFSRGGGMEHQTMSFMTHFRYPLMAHELAHQWFGDYITCGTWGDLWLNEGFATYFTGVPMEINPEFGDWEEWKKSRVAHITSETDGSVYVHDTLNEARLFDARLTYSKGAYVLHIIRKQIGDSAFFKAIKAYVTDPELAYRTASTDQLFKHFQAQTPIDLTAIKTEWIYGEGYPNFTANWEQNNNVIFIELTQSTSHTSVPFYHLKVPVEFRGTSDTLLVYLDQSQEQTFFEIPVNFNVESVVIDPQLDLISGTKSVINVSKMVDFAVYPNPTSDYLTVQPSSTQFKIHEYRIFNSLGQLVMHNYAPTNQHSFNINTAQLAQGQYTLELVGKEKKLKQPFTVAR